MKTAGWKAFWVSLFASLVATLLWAMIFGSPGSHVRFRMEFERAPAGGMPQNGGYEAPGEVRRAELHSG